MHITRRDFFKYLAGITTLSSPFTGIISNTPRDVYAHSSSSQPSRVVIVKRNNVFSTTSTLSHNVVNNMVESGILKLTGAGNIRDAWRSLFSENEKIGIKINSLGGQPAATHNELSYAVAEQLVRHCGCRPFNIIIWDRLTTELLKAGYKPSNDRGAIRCFGTDGSYETVPEISGSIGSCFSRIIASECDAIINIPVLKDHDLAGVSLGLKNFYGAIHNPNKYHDNNCNPYIADLNLHPYIKNRCRLTIIDGLRAQCNGGPAFKSQWSWNYQGIILSRDPVAADTIGLKIIEKQRHLKGLPTLKEADRYPSYIKTAASKQLGTADMKKIELIRC